MYFNGKLSIDPSQITKIKRIPPTRAFKRILYFMTFGMVSDKMEQETFTAVSILQQLFQSFNSLGINNLVRLSHDDINFYLDTEGKHDDLKSTLDKYDLEINEAMSNTFQQLLMVLEHHTDNFHYLINITIDRTHKKGVAPINIHVDGLLKHFQGGSADEVKQKMQSVFANQDSYNSFMMSSKTEFEQFLGQINMAIRRVVQVTDVKMQHKAKMVVPKQVPASAQNLSQNHQWNYSSYSPVYHGYYGTGDAFFYAWLWTDMCHHSHIHIHDTTLVSENNAPLMDVGSNGVDASQNALFDNSQPFETRLEESNLQYNESTGAFYDTNNPENQIGYDGFDSSGSEDSFKGGDFGGDDSGSSCNAGSSCSSNSSCNSSSCSSSSCSSSSCSSSSCSSCSS